MSSQILLSGGDKYYSYSGILFGDVSAPATIPMINIDSTGLKDSLIQVLPYSGQPVNDSSDESLGIQIKIDDVTVYKQQNKGIPKYGEINIENNIQIFVPRQSKLEIISLNTTDNNTQERGCTVIGYYL